MSIIKPNKFIDASLISSELDSAMLAATREIKRTWNITPKVVEVAYYHHHGFGELFDPYVNEVSAYARSIGVEYEVVKIEKPWGEGLAGRLSELSRDPSVHGIRARGWHLHRGEEDYVYNELAPHKDIECKTHQRNYEHLQGHAPGFIRPELGAIRRILRRTLPIRLDAATIALPIGEHSFNWMLPLAPILGSLSANVVMIRRLDAQALECLGRADAIITSFGKHGYLDHKCVREGQIVIDLERWEEERGPYFKAYGEERGDANVDAIRAIVAAIAERSGIFLIAKRQIFLNLLYQFLLGRGDDGLRIDKLLRA